jgi:hypothetical protein
MSMIGPSPLLMMIISRGVQSDASFFQARGFEYFQRSLRLDLTKLDQLVTTLPAGM